MPFCADVAACLSAAALGRRECAQHGYTPLHRAAKKGHANCVALLAERGANVEATDEVRCAVPVANHIESAEP
jgi:hypothetical protein